MFEETEMLLEFKSQQHMDMFKNDPECGESNSNIIEHLNGRKRFLVVKKNTNGSWRWSLVGAGNIAGMFLWPSEIEKYFNKLPYLQERVEEVPQGFTIKTESKIVIKDFTINKDNYTSVIDTIKRTFE
ncbi:hypothetical protein MYO4S_00098 [Serratia phage 4S]|nr:hypothetical protein MYO4S_00098 [Serratia phage 4S]